MARKIKSFWTMSHKEKVQAVEAYTNTEWELLDIEGLKEYDYQSLQLRAQLITLEKQDIHHCLRIFPNWGIDVCVICDKREQL